MFCLHVVQYISTLFELKEYVIKTMKVDPILINHYLTIVAAVNIPLFIKKLNDKNMYINYI
jgi:hypothetical protein